nr:nitroreductase family protein [Parabacteroides goldsteinii]
MDFLELSKKRFSARNYSADKIEQSKIDYIIECARLAPSAVNYQPWHFMVVISEEQKQKLRQCYDREWFANVPAYIVVCTDETKAWVRKSDNKNHADIDAAIATEHICLAATAVGLGSCWVCNFDLNLFKTNFQLSSGEYPVAIISLGYIKEQPERFTTRKDKNEIVTIL